MSVWIYENRRYLELSMSLSQGPVFVPVEWIEEELGVAAENLEYGFLFSDINSRLRSRFLYAIQAGLIPDPYRILNGGTRTADTLELSVGQEMISLNTLLGVASLTSLLGNLQDAIESHKNVLFKEYSELFEDRQYTIKF